MSLKSLIDRLFTKHLLISNCVGMCGCLALGDFLEQKIATRLRGKNEPADVERVGRMAASGVPVAAADTVWYKWLDKRYQGASTKMALRKAGVDFVLGAPLLNMVWLTTIELLEGKSFSEATRNSAHKIPIVIFGELFFYLPAQFLNFKFIPPRFRVIYLAVISTVWVVFLSFVQHDMKYHLFTPLKDKKDSAE